MDDDLLDERIATLRAKLREALRDIARHDQNAETAFDLTVETQNQTCFDLGCRFLRWARERANDADAFRARIKRLERGNGRG